jgi:hypothetical protein
VKNNKIVIKMIKLKKSDDENESARAVEEQRAEKLEEDLQRKKRGREHDFEFDQEMKRARLDSSLHVDFSNECLPTSNSSSQSSFSLAQVPESSNSGCISETVVCPSPITSSTSSIVQSPSVSPSSILPIQTSPHDSCMSTDPFDSSRSTTPVDSSMSTAKKKIKFVLKKDNIKNEQKNGQGVESTQNAIGHHSGSERTFKIKLKK